MSSFTQLTSHRIVKPALLVILALALTAITGGVAVGMLKVAPVSRSSVPAIDIPPLPAPSPTAPSAFNAVGDPATDTVTHSPAPLPVLTSLSPSQSLSDSADRPPDNVMLPTGKPVTTAIPAVTGTPTPGPMIPVPRPSSLPTVRAPSPTTSFTCTVQSACGTPSPHPSTITVTAMPSLQPCQGLSATTPTCTPPPIPTALPSGVPTYQPVPWPLPSSGPAPSYDPANPPHCNDLGMPADACDKKPPTYPVESTNSWDWSLRVNACSAISAADASRIVNDTLTSSTYYPGACTYTGTIINKQNQTRAASVGFYGSNTNFIVQASRSGQPLAGVGEHATVIDDGGGSVQVVASEGAYSVITSISSAVDGPTALTAAKALATRGLAWLAATKPPVPAPPTAATPYPAGTNGSNDNVPVGGLLGLSILGLSVGVAAKMGLLSKVFAAAA